MRSLKDLARHVPQRRSDAPSRHARRFRSPTLVATTIATLLVAAVSCTTNDGEDANDAATTTTQRQWNLPSGPAPAAESNPEQIDEILAAHAPSVLDDEQRRCLHTRLAADPGLANALDERADDQATEALNGLATQCVSRSMLPRLLDNLNESRGGTVTDAHAACIAAEFDELDVEDLDHQLQAMLTPEETTDTEPLELILRECDVPPAN